MNYDEGVEARGPLRRPLAMWCAGFTFGIFIQRYAASEQWAGLWGLLAGSGVCLYIFIVGKYRLGVYNRGNESVGNESVGNESGRKRINLPVAVLLLLASFCCGSLLMYLEMGRDSPFPLTEAAVVRGTVIQVQEEEERCRITLATGIRQRILVSVMGTPESLGVVSYGDLTGRQVVAKGEIGLPAPRKNPGGFDYRLYLRTKDIFALMDAESSEIRVSQRVDRPFSHGLALLREGFSERLRQRCKEEQAGLILGMLFGDKSGMEDELYESFQKNGTAHLLAVSGIHVNVIYLYFRRLLGGRRDLLPSLASLLMLLLYAALSGFSPSVTRASLMIFFNIAALLLRRNYDLCTGTASAAMMLLALQPYRLFDMGFQLSFLAVLSLAVILPWAEQKSARLADRTKQSWIQGLMERLCPLLVISLVMAPVTAYCFQYFSWSSFLLNPLLIPLAGAVVPLGMALFLIHLLPGAVGALLFDTALNATAIPTELMISASQFFSDRGWGYFAVVSPPMGVVLLFYAALFFYCSESSYILRRKGRRRTVQAAFAAILIFSAVFPFAIGEAELPLPFSRKTYPMVFVDVGQGDCLHIRTPSGKNILIDGGGSINYDVGKKTLAPYLLKNGVDHIDLALVTHLHTDHYGGIRELAAVLPIDRVGIYAGNELRQEELRREWRSMGIGKKQEPDFLFLKKGDRVRLDEGVWVEVLAPEARSREEYERLLEDEQDENASSLVMAVHYKGVRILMTGDMDFEGENALLAGSSAGGHRDGAEGPLAAHILKTGHHGSRYSTSEDFLTAVNPSAAVIQVGKNNFGHPSARVIELFQNSGIMTYRTDLQGAILVQKITEGEAVLSDLHEEKIWHISL